MATMAVVTLDRLRDGVRDNADLRWIARAELASLGIPAPVRKLLEART